MKIGEFAKRHNVSIDTVRHYIAEGLLTPLRENTQYSFSEIDSSVMDTILLLKSMNFKLDEMKGYLLFQTMYTSDFSMALKPFKSEFEAKLAQNLEEIERLQKMNRLIESKLNAYTEKYSFKRGVALSSVTTMRCPVCGKPLELENPLLLHNEVMEGALLCPDCGKKFFIRYGFIADKPIPEIEDRTDGISEMIENYVRKNDKDYVLNIREHYQKSAEIAKDHCKNSRNVMISGDSAGFLNSAFLRSMPADARLFVHFDDNATIKYFLEDIFPKETIVYSGDIENAPFADEMDYVFWQDYDVISYLGKEIKLYPHISENAWLDCLKVLIYKKDLNFPDEKRFLSDMQNIGWKYAADYKSDRVLRKRGSSDLSGFGIDSEFETQFGLYSFKKP